MNKFKCIAVAAVAKSNMRNPWRCPYCDQTSRRRANMSVHVDRKHKGLPNPLPGFKRANPFDAYTSQRPQVMPPKSFSPNCEISKTPTVDIRFPNFEAVLQQVRVMNSYKISVLVVEVIRRMNNIGFWRSPS